MTKLPLSEFGTSTCENEPSTFAKRLMTGKSAENFFVEHYKKEQVFRDAALLDFTYSGCGYDYQLTHKDGRAFAVEVKGLKSLHGSISMTEKEYRVASELKEKFFLYIVSDFESCPMVTNIENPVNSNLIFKETKRDIIQVSWNAKI